MFIVEAVGSHHGGGGEHRGGGRRFRGDAPPFHDVLPEPRDVDVGDVVRPVDAPHVEVERRLLLRRHLCHEPLRVAIVEPAYIVHSRRRMVAA